jgi:hypothetical protein
MVAMKGDTPILIGRPREHGLGEGAGAVVGDAAPECTAVHDRRGEMAAMADTWSRVYHSRKMGVWPMGA